MAYRPVEEMSDRDARAAADVAAARVLEQHWPEMTIPVDPVRIARRLGAEVFSAQLGNDIWGMLVGTPLESRIYLDADQPPNRYRFSAAHEVGHYVERAARPDDGSDVSFVDRRTDPNKFDALEVFANQFAGALLMPADTMRRHHRLDPDPVSLARRFDVSLAAMQYRLRRLGL